jgi:3-hydroxyacyl-[acyl-carrier-protein] dehydratase
VSEPPAGAGRRDLDASRRSQGTLGVPEIEAILPHRAPFLFVDRVLEIEPGKRAVGLKAVTAGEPYFAGHFPGQPLMPGVLILEALAQLGAICLLSEPGNQGLLPLLGGIEDARFRTAVIPGDTLRLEVEIVKARGRTGRGRGKAMLSDGRLAAEASLLFVLAPRNEV